MMVVTSVGCRQPPLQDPVEQVLFATSADMQVACYRIPAIAAVDQQLIVAVDERVPSCADLRGSRDINIVARLSSDGGASWGPPQRILDLPDGQAVSDPSFVYDAMRGRLFLFVNLMDHDNAPGRYQFLVLHSDDAGHTWSTPTHITDTLIPESWRQDFVFITSGRGVQSASGTLLHTLVHLDRGAFVILSQDHGQTWTLAPTPVWPADESKIITLPSGTWMVNSRVRDAGYRWVHTSSDEGRTWTSRPDTQLVDPAVNAALVREGNLLYFANAAHPQARQDLVLRRRDVTDARWTVVDTLHRGSAAYVTATMLRVHEGQHMGLTFERGDYAEVVFRRLDPNALLAE